MQKFHTPTPITAVVNIPAGRVQLIAAERTDTTVEIRPANASKSRDVKAAEHTTVDYRDDDGVLQITTTATNHYLGPTGSIEVTIKLPAGSHVQANTGSAELRTLGRLGEITFDGAYHHVNIDEAARLHLTAHDGDIEISRMNGPAHVSTARGDITIAEAQHGTLELRTQTGDITITAATGTSATLNAGTTHGRITNTLTNNSTPQLHIHATTSHGDITAHGH